MFILKKLLSAFIMPLPFLLIIAFLGLLILWFSRRKYLAASLLSLSFIGIFLLSFYPVSNHLLKTMEIPTKFQPSAIQPINYVLVLGSGNIENDTIPIASTLSYAAIERLLEGIRILNAYPNSKLILSGYTAMGHVTAHALQMKKVALSLGVSEDRIITFETTKDTNDEAIKTKALVQDQPIALVTSAFHMQRALNEFHRQNINVTIAPTHFLAQGDVKEPWLRYAPSGQYLHQSDIYWHEKLGLWWQQAKRILGTF